MPWRGTARAFGGVGLCPGSRADPDNQWVLSCHTVCVTVWVEGRFTVTSPVAIPITSKDRTRLRQFC